jgi:geranylgeranyl diphosphate synthase type I
MSLRPSPSAVAQGRREASAAGPGPFHAMLDEIRREVDARLGKLFEQRLADTQSLGPDVSALIDALRDLTMRGGKRFRPALLFAAYHAVDDAAPDAIAFEAGAALELLQTYLLVHDDWMDRDDVRRGGPAVHAMMARHHGSRTAGDAAGVLAGDYAAALALETLLGAGALPERMVEAARIFARIQQDAICGQELDLAGDAKDVEIMHDLKTGSYTVRGPMLLGATLAGASSAVMTRLLAFAHPLGVAFQLRDDLLGAFGDPAQTGKPPGSDIRAGKRTALFDEALSRTPPRERSWLRDTVSRRDASDDEIAAVVAVYERCGARQAVERRLEQLVEKAIGALDESRLSKRGTSWLVAAATALTIREH